MGSERSKGSRGARTTEASRGIEEANAVFRDAYAVARDRSAAEVPILIVLADDVVLRHGRRRIALHFTPSGFHPLKGAAHVLVALLSLLALTPDGEMDGASRQRLEAMKRALGTAESSLEEAGELVARALQVARQMTDDLMRDPRVERSRIESAAREARPLLLELTQKAANARLVALHARVQELLAELTPDDRRALHVVVAGDHQARRRSLGMQYFERRLGGAEGCGDRVIYGESVGSEDDAVALVGTCRIDRHIARTVFGDANRLQQDVLGDATKKELADLDPPPIT